MSRLPPARAMILPIFLLGGVALAACVTPAPAPAELAAASLIVTGSATYRERMAAPKGSMLKVELSDTSRADAPSISLADWSDSLDDRGVPKRFTLRVIDTLDPRGTYTLRATVRGPDGALLWTTDTVHRVASSGTVDAGELVMIRVPSTPAADPAPAPAAPDLAGTEWLVEAMGGVAVITGSEPRIKFTGDGQINGTTGCNRFFGQYEQAGGALTFSGIGMTRMACMAPGVMEQETTFAGILSGAARLEADALGAITIRGENGIAFTARRLDAAADAAGGDPAVLMGETWKVEDLNRGGVIDRSNLTLTFGAGGQMTGSTHCNTIGGSYTASETTITFGPVRSTLRACTIEALSHQERTFTTALQGEMAWRITADGALELTREGGHRILLRR
ncbi:META domain-containing protein [Hyphomonas sp.]|uniref:META domain-containing protein n=1 Tax=Hyphomonas sp. TaxID=87 RepID=UPI003919A6E9